MYRIENYILYYVILLIKISTVQATKITSVQSNMNVRLNEKAILRWKIADDETILTTKIYCTYKTKEKKGTRRFAKGSFDNKRKSFEFKTTEVAKAFNHRLSAKFETDKQSNYILILEIYHTEYSDTNIYTCVYGQHTSHIQLSIYKELEEISTLPTEVKLDNVNKNVNFSTILCGSPKPKVTIQFMFSELKEIHGDVYKNKSEPESKCFKYSFSGITLNSQKFCGEELKVEYKGVKKTLRRRVRLTVKLQPEPPRNTEIAIINSDCASVRWDGPNIGSCAEPTLRYDVILRKGGVDIRTYETSSNNVEICGIKVADKSFEAHVRTRIEKKNSTWSQAKLVVEPEIFDGMRTLIIACSVIFVFFVVILTAYCCYRNKCKLKCCCSNCAKKKKKINRLLSDRRRSKDEVVQLASLTPDVARNRKLSRKMSEDGLLSDNKSLANGEGVNTLNRNHLQEPDDDMVNQSGRFNSLQRNIERERKKQQEEERKQRERREQQDEFFLPRRNTDSNLLRDPAYNMLTPRGPLYDFLPQTRTSQSTTSTGHSVHDDEEYTILPPRRSTDIDTPRDSMNQSIPDTDSTAPLYDVLPRSNTQTSHYSEQSDASIYDSVPRKRVTTQPQSIDDPTKTPVPPPKNNGLVYDLSPTKFPVSKATLIQNTDDQNNIKETIYDVPNKSGNQASEPVTQSPFTSYKPYTTLHFKTPQQ